MRNRRWMMFGALAGVVLTILAISVAFASANTGGSTKQAFLQHVAAEQTAAARVTPAPKDHSAPVVTSCPQKITPGIFRAGEQSDYIMHTYILENAAVAVASTGTPYFLLAGALQSNPQQGVVLVQRVRVDPCATTGEYPINADVMPSQAGALTITGINGDTVAFRSTTGTTGTFDYVTDQFAA